jgi:hypothetical protein
MRFGIDDRALALLIGCDLFGKTLHTFSGHAVELSTHSSAGQNCKMPAFPEITTVKIAIVSRLPYWLRRCGHDK